MNEYYMNVDFTKSDIQTNLRKLVQNDYNSTKINFTFTKTGSRVLFKLKYPDSTEYVDEIANNVLIFGPGILSKNGRYEYEISLYNANSKLTDYAIGEFYVRNELISTDEIVEPDDRVPILDNLINEVNGVQETLDQAIIDVNGAIDEVNNLDLDVSKSGKVATVTLTKKDNTTKVVTLNDGTSLMFQWNGTSLGIKTDEDANYTYVDLQGVQGETGPMGAPFTIKKTYSSVAEMNADFDNMNIGDYVMIASSVEVQDNAKLYTRGEQEWIFISDFSGAQGIQGPVGATPNIQIGTVTSGVSPSVTRTGTNENPVLNFVLEKGDKGDTGDTGATGNGIASIEKTNTSGLVDTYTITYTNGTTTTFQVTNGEDGEVTQTQLDALQRQVDYNEKYANALIKETTTGTELTINDTAECPMPMVLSPSELEQASTTGKNLLNGTIPFSNYSNYNANYTKTATTITVTSTATNQYAGTTINSIDIINGETYTISMKATYDTDGLPNFRLGKDNTSTANIIGSGARELKNGYYLLTKTFTASNNFNLVISFYPSQVSTNTSGHTSTFYDMQIEKNSEATDYEPYTNGASPNPDYPQDIHTISGNNTITIQNKNIFDETLLLNASGWTKSGDEYSGSYGPLYNYLNFTNFKANTQYTFSFESYWSSSTSTTSGTPRFIFDYSDGTTSDIIVSATSSTKYVMTSTPNKTVTKLRFTYNNGRILHLKHLQIEVNSTDTPYVPYKAYTLPLTLGNLEYCKIGNYEDEFYKATASDTGLTAGKWYIKKNIGKTTDDIGSTGKTISDMVSNATVYSYCGVTVSGTTITYASALTVANTIYYPLATPTYTLLNDTLQSQLNEIYNWLLSYKDQTNISQTNNDLPFIITATTVYDLNKLLDRVETLENEGE